MNNVHSSKFGLRSGMRLLMIVLHFFLSSCSMRQKANDTEILKRDDKLYERYLHGSLVQARESMQESIALAEIPKLKPEGHAWWLFFDYARLYGVETKTGNTDLAHAYLIKTRYWLLVYHELKTSIRQAIESDKQYSDAKIIEFVDQWDKDHNDGNPPAYTNEIADILRTP